MFRFVCFCCVRKEKRNLFEGGNESIEVKCWWVLLRFVKCDEGLNGRPWTMLHLKFTWIFTRGDHILISDLGGNWT